MSFRVGDVVAADGASAIPGDVIAVDDHEDQITVRWRSVTTTELEYDLELFKGEPPPAVPMIAMTPERIDAVTRLLRKSVRKIDPHFDHEQIVEDLLAEARGERANG